MAKTSIYLPDELSEQAHGYGISISEVAQGAVRRAVEQARGREAAVSDMSAVIARLRGESAQEEADEANEGFEDGVAWAKKHAHKKDLEFLAEQGMPSGHWASLISFFSLKMGERVAEMDVDGEEPYWRGFVSGAVTVWDQVKAHV
jgi:hypothetical protein